MKSAILVSADPDLFAHLRDALVAQGAETDEPRQHVRLGDANGRSLLAYRHDEEFAWEYRDGPHRLGSGIAIPDMSAMTGVHIECRWEDLLAATVHGLAMQLKHPCWLVDNDGVVWEATAIDPLRLSL
jgi:hypothetical protein